MFAVWWGGSYTVYRRPGSWLESRSSRLICNADNAYAYKQALLYTPAAPPPSPPPPPPPPYRLSCAPNAVRQSGQLQLCIGSAPASWLDCSLTCTEPLDAVGPSSQWGAWGMLTITSPWEQAWVHNETTLAFQATHGVVDAYVPLGAADTALNGEHSFAKFT